MLALGNPTPNRSDKHTHLSKKPCSPARSAIRTSICQAADFVIIPIMVFVHGITVLIHVVIVIFELVIIIIPALPTLIAAAPERGAIWSLGAFLTWCANSEASVASFW
jgi:hypothetical protein